MSDRGGKKGKERKDRETPEPPKTPVRPANAEPPENAKEKERRVEFARSVVSPELTKKENLEKWELPADRKKPGDYMVELNLLHRGGLMEADSAFLKIYAEVVKDENRAPERVAKTYYSCYMSIDEWQQLIAKDGENSDPRDRAIFRIWPDFPLQQQIDRSIPTIKADAATRSYDASGEGIVWAVIDSGIDWTHPHFGDPGQPNGHTLLSPEVAELHRCFAPQSRTINNVPVRKRLNDPDSKPADADPKTWPEVRQRYVREHVSAALADDFGHGTHVGGIIAGGLSVKDLDAHTVRPEVFERTFQLDEEGFDIKRDCAKRTVRNPARLRGIAQNCKLISLRVLDETGNGRSCDIIRALEYIRENLNRDPKLLRVHGVNLSVGYDFDAEMFACGQSPLCVEVDRLVQSGVVVVTAAGNTGYGPVGTEQRTTKVGISNTINDPGNAAQAITVGATHRHSPHTYGVSYFSSKGPTGDGRLKPDLVAPGERITSCAAGSKLREIRCLPAQTQPQLNPPISLFQDEAPSPAAGANPKPSPTPAGSPPAEPAAAPPATPPAEPAAAPAGLPPVEPAAAPLETPPADQPAPRLAVYIDDSGTSMAAPHVSGAIAAFLSIRWEFVGKPAEVKRIFLASATSLGRERYFEGHGLLDLMRAIQSI